MQMNYLKILTNLSLLSLLFINGCVNIPEKNNVFLLDISGSNNKNVTDSFKKINELYQESGPNDTFVIYFFSSTDYLVYSGKRLPKDRDFLPMLETQYKKAMAIPVAHGTNFELVKKVIESSSSNSKFYLFTDGFFENSKIQPVLIPNSSKIEIFGLNIQNNELFAKLFPDKENIIIHFQ